MKYNFILQLEKQFGLDSREVENYQRNFADTKVIPGTLSTKENANYGERVFSILADNKEATSINIRSHSESIEEVFFFYNNGFYIINCRGELPNEQVVKIFYYDLDAYLYVLCKTNRNNLVPKDFVTNGLIFDAASEFDKIDCDIFDFIKRHESEIKKGNLSGKSRVRDMRTETKVEDNISNGELPFEI